ncbi:T9SS type A sorting domain-containing protein [Ochrovirga pacifica]|uniref:T9SS type A sorting domain-containing protein n=1 Tax=Ochrovirga pacifica TaxID=1042376 RepID=UPI0002559B62|nr:T9SS type A sorting domain-containing protein [Ochrovirga pacifica]
MKKTYPTLLLFLISIFSFSQTFDWETAVHEGEQITQKVSGITAAFTTSIEDETLYNPNGYSGSSGNIVYTYMINQNTSVTVSFSSPINITSVFAFDPTTSGDYDWTFTPSGGNNSSVTQLITKNAGSTVALNWTNVNSFTITSAAGEDSFALDDIVFTVPTLSVANVHTEKIALYPNPSSDYIYIEKVDELKKYTIYNVIGVEIVKGVLAKDFKIDIRNLVNGVYYVSFDNGKNIKFIKK